MNRLKQKDEDDREPDGPGIYFCVGARCGTWYISTAMARHIEACLDADPRPGWIRFVDLSGASVRVRSRDVEYLNQSTPEQRALEREFNRAMRRERKVDRDWEEDE
jgi:hypothetical protein